MIYKTLLNCYDEFRKFMTIDIWYEVGQLGKEKFHKSACRLNINYKNCLNLSKNIIFYIHSTI